MKQNYRSSVRNRKSDSCPNLILPVHEKKKEGKMSGIIFKNLLMKVKGKLKRKGKTNL